MFQYHAIQPEGYALRLRPKTLEPSPTGAPWCSGSGAQRAPGPSPPLAAGGVGVAVLQPRAAPPDRRSRRCPAASQAAEQRRHRERPAASVFPAPGERVELQADGHPPPGGGHLRAFVKPRTLNLKALTP